MARFKGPEIVKQIDEALDKGLARFLINTQSKLSASSPVLTGRLASSWMISKGQPSKAKAAERQRGTTRVSIEKYSGPITADDDWWITNNLPYARRAAFDPGYVGRRGTGAGDWFTAIVTGLPKDAERTIDFFLRKIK